MKPFALAAALLLAAPASAQVLAPGRASLPMEWLGFRSTRGLAADAPYEARTGNQRIGFGQNGTALSVNSNDARRMSLVLDPTEIFGPGTGIGGVRNIVIRDGQDEGSLTIRATNLRTGERISTARLGRIGKSANGHVTTVSLEGLDQPAGDKVRIDIITRDLASPRDNGYTLEGDAATVHSTCTVGRAALHRTTVESGSIRHPEMAKSSGRKADRGGKDRGGKGNRGGKSGKGRK